MKSKPHCRALPCLFSRLRPCPAKVAIVIILTGLVCKIAAQAQDGLSIGDKLPDVKLDHVINHSSPTIELSHYRGQLLIIDFWATWCSPCIAMFPKTDSLQKQFEGKVRFLPVTYESREKVEKLFKRSQRLANVKLPMAVSEKTLHKLFPHRELPHYVWIDRTGTVKAITGSQEVNAETIREMLSASPVTLKEKKDRFLPYDRQTPLMLNKIGMSKDMMKFQSVLTLYVDGLSSRFDILRHEDGSIARITVCNGTFKTLYGLAFSSPELFIERNRIVIEASDRSKFIMEGSSAASREEIREWMRENSFCYEIMVPPHLSPDIFAIMRQDLVRIFPEYHASLQKRKVKCLVLERTSNIDKIRTKGDPINFSFAGYGATMTNCSLGLLLSQLNGINLQHLDMPVIDGTGYTGNVDLKLDCDMSDPMSLNTALKAYDLAFVSKEVAIDMLVIRDSEKKITP